PKAFGFVLDERLGKAAFWCWLIGFYLAFMPLYVVGLEGMTRRMQHYDRPEWYPWLLVAGMGTLIILCGIALQIAQLWVSIRGRAQRRDLTGDPWDGRSLEWSTTSPPPAFNFAVLPNVTSDEPYWTIKQQARAKRQLVQPEPEYTPLNTHPRDRIPHQRHAAQQSPWFRHRVLSSRHRIFPERAHFVAGDTRPRRRI